MRPTSRSPARTFHIIAVALGVTVMTGYLGWFWYAVATTTHGAVIRVASLMSGIG